MAEKRPGRATPESARPRRSAPTIDLTATEVAQSADVSAASTAEAAAQSHAPEPATEATATSVEPELTAGTTPPEPSPEASPEAPTDGEGPDAREAPSGRQMSGWGAPLAAGCIGAVVAAAILVGLWYSRVLPGARAPDVGPQLAEFERQITRVQNDMQSLQGAVKTLQSRIEAVQTAPAPAADQKAIGALAQRVATVENALNNLPANDAQQIRDRLAASEKAAAANAKAIAELNTQIGALKSGTQTAGQQAQTADQAIAQLRARVEQLAKELPAQVTPAQFQAVQQKLAALDQSVQAAQKQIAQNAAAASKVRIALAASALRNAVLSHAPYETELAEVRAIGADANALAPLQRFASTGVPSDSQLAADLSSLLPALTQASELKNEASGGFLDRLRTNASRLVRVTPVNAPTGDDPSDVLARLRVEAAHENVNAALSDIAKLPQPAQAKAANWRATVQARREALNAAQALASEAARALGGQ